MHDARLTRGEIHRIVNQYLGVEGGYLADFTYRSHHDFYVELDIDVDPNEMLGTTRERFIKILGDLTVEDQAKVLRSVLSKYPVGSSELRTADREAELLGYLSRLTGVASPSPKVTSEVVDRAIRDADSLLRTTGATSGVDRVHTAIHGYLRAVCTTEEIGFSGDPTMNQLFRLLRDNHEAFSDTAHRGQDIETILRSFGAILDALNPIRNRASVAHPNDHLLDDAEAQLVINAARTILHYIDAKVSAVATI